MKISLPAQFNRKTMYSFIDKIIDETYSPRYDEIVLDAHSLRFIKPAGVTVLSNLIQWLIKRGVKISIDYPELSIHDSGIKDPIKYLDDSGFFQYYGEKIYTTSSLRSTTLPLRHVAFQEYHAWLENTFIPWFMHQVGVTQRDTVEDIKICLQEIFNNISDHSTEHIGCVFAQYYPAYNQVIITASDFGVGIPALIRQKEKDLNDAEALAWAIREGNSTKSLPTNTGAGLDILVSSLVVNKKGKVYIHSGQGILSCLFRKGLVVTPQNCNGVYPGTLFEITLNTDSFHDEDIEEEFTWF